MDRAAYRQDLIAFLRDNGWVGPKEAAESKSRESALWACLAKLNFNLDVRPLGVTAAVLDRDLPALCKCLGVEVGDE